MLEQNIQYFLWSSRWIIWSSLVAIFEVGNSWSVCLLTYLLSRGKVAETVLCVTGVRFKSIVINPILKLHSSYTSASKFSSLLLTVLGLGHTEVAFTPKDPDQGLHQSVKVQCHLHFQLILSAFTHVVQTAHQMFHMWIPSVRDRWRCFATRCQQPKEEDPVA